MKYFRTALTHPTTWALALLVTAGSAQAQSAEKGKVAFIKNGCWQCHGFEGQGGQAGLPLAPNTKPLAYITAFVRNTRGAMPPYSEKILPNADLADIHAYLQSRPAAPDPKTIPLLN